VTPPESAPASARPALELLLVVVCFSAFTVWLTSPLAFHLGSFAYRQDNGDGQFSIWNVAWVAHALTSNPAGVFDANIFYPHRGTLAYSEANLGAGLLAAPAYWLTNNAYAAHNFALLCSFVLSASATYYLVRHLFNNRPAAVVSAVCFAFAPHIFAHLLHIQLLMTAGIPLSLLAFHRLSERPTGLRGAALGAAMALQVFFCAYYAVFTLLIIGYAVLFTATMRGWWTNRRYWVAVGVAACVAMAGAAPAVAPYFAIHRASGPLRALSDAERYSADWRAYLASSAYAHSWLLDKLGHWNEVLFPGYTAVAFGVGGALVCWRGTRRDREIGGFYGSLTALAAWASFGPSAGLYRWLYAVVPGFTFMRAPSRFGLIAVFGVAVLAAAGVRRATERLGRLGHGLAVALALVAAAELAVPLDFSRAPDPAPVYRQLAMLPRGAVLELPAYSAPLAFMRTRYMVASTWHWMPLVNAYSDMIPPDFSENLNLYAEFPSAPSLARLAPMGVRYVVLHVDQYGAQRDGLAGRLDAFGGRLRRLYADDHAWLYEIVEAVPVR
jgi:hypothetical protein